SPAGGVFTSAQKVSISTTTASAAIYYTVDGSDPTNSPSALRYAASITVSGTETLNAVVKATGYSNSAVGSATYIINLPPAATPTFSSSGGTYTSTQTVAIGTITGGAAIYYTTDGSNPASSS